MCGVERVFSLRPKVGEILTLFQAFTQNHSQTVHSMIVRANQRAPLVADYNLRCLEKPLQHLSVSGTNLWPFPYPGSSTTSIYPGQPVSGNDERIHHTNIHVILDNCV